MKTEEHRAAFNEVLRKSIISIIKLQERAESMLAPLLELNLNSPLRATLSPEDRATWDEMQQARIKTQR